MKWIASWARTRRWPFGLIGALGVALDAVGIVFVISDEPVSQTVARWYALPVWVITCVALVTLVFTNNRVVSTCAATVAVVMLLWFAALVLFGVYLVILMVVLTVGGRDVNTELAISPVALIVPTICLLVAVSGLWKQHRTRDHVVAGAR